MAKKEKTTRNFALRLDSETMEAIEKWATDEFRSVNGQIQWVLDQALKKNGAFTGNFRDAMANGEITAAEFNKALLELGSKPVAVEAAKSTKTFNKRLSHQLQHLCTYNT